MGTVPLRYRTLQQLQSGLHLGVLSPGSPSIVVSMFPNTTFSEQALGDFSTLPERLHAEAAASNSVIAWFALVGASAHVGLA